MQQKGMGWVIGASGGLGRATAQAFAQNGWSVDCGGPLLCRRNLSAGEGVTVLPLDVTSEESCTAFVKKALGMENRVDVLVCAAAQLVLGSCENTTVDELDKLLNVNVLGTVRMIQRALPLMRAQKSGKIILFSSINGLLGIPFPERLYRQQARIGGVRRVSGHGNRRFRHSGLSGRAGRPSGRQQPHPSSRQKMKRTPFTRRRMKTPAPLFITTKKNGLFPNRLGPENRAERPATAYALPSEGRQARPASGRAFAYPSSRQP